MAKESKQEITTRRQEGQLPQRMLSPFDEMERMFENFFPTGWLRPMRTAPLWAELPPGAKIPPVDIIDREEEILLRAEMPGIDKDSIDISLSDNSVTIRGSSRHEEKESEENYYRSEISRGAFSRTVSLPADVDGDKTKATFKEGVLELTMPKVERSRAAFDQGRIVPSGSPGSRRDRTIPAPDRPFTDSASRCVDRCATAFHPDTMLTRCGPQARHRVRDGTGSRQSTPAPSGPVPVHHPEQVDQSRWHR